MFVKTQSWSQRKRNERRQSGCLRRLQEIAPNSLGKKRRERQGRKERYTQLNAEFQRIASKDKEVFLNEQCKEIEENNRMGKARDLFKKKKNEDIKGLFHLRMGWIKDRNCKDLTEAEDIKKR